MHLTRNTAEECVMARIMRDAVMHQKNFSLKNHGSWKAAEAAGQAWVDEQLEVLPPSRMNEEGRLTRRNRSGVVGIHLVRSIRRKSKRKKYEYWKWIARWPDCPITGGVTWPINEETTDDDAFVLAYLSREMRSTDRDEVRRSFSRIKGRKKHSEILDQKLLKLV